MSYYVYRLGGQVNSDGPWQAPPWWLLTTGRTGKIHGNIQCRFSCFIQCCNHIVLGI